MNLMEQEREKYRATWKNPDYRITSPGLRHIDQALEWMKPEPGASMTDWGCGTGAAAAELFKRGFDMRLVDIAGNAYVGALPFVEACLWDLPPDLSATDYGFCADVMEHIPTERVDDVLAGIAERTTKRCFFQIALFPDSHFTGNGPLHLSVFPPEWWQERLEQKFKHCEYRMIKTRHLLAVAG
jgi:hypothetical protein